MATKLYPGRRFIGTITRRGQVTVPAEVRRHLGVADGGKVAFEVTEDGEIGLTTVEFPTVESLRGKRATLASPRSRREMLEVGREDGIRLPR